MKLIRYTLNAIGRETTFTLRVKDDAGPDEIRKRALGKLIVNLSRERGETLSQWARDLGYSKMHVHRVAYGRSENEKIRAHIEKRLGHKFWNE